MLSKIAEAPVLLRCTRTYIPLAMIKNNFELTKRLIHTFPATKYSVMTNYDKQLNQPPAPALKLYVQKKPAEWGILTMTSA